MSISITEPKVLKVTDARKDLLSSCNYENFNDVKEYLEDWWDRWIVEVETSQIVINTKFLTSEYSDAIKFNLTKNVLDQAAEECIDFDLKEKRVTANFIALRRKSK